MHGTALGIGERVGNAEMDLLIVNLYLLGLHTGDLSKLSEYCRLASERHGHAGARSISGGRIRRLPHRAPGVHAAAIMKARKKGDEWLADRVYSSVPAAMFGFRQRIEISPVSGLSNVKCWLEEHGYDPEEAAVSDALFCGGQGHRPGAGGGRVPPARGGGAPAERG